jgi:hypothetical protein
VIASRGLEQKPATNEGGDEQCNHEQQIAMTIVFVGHLKPKHSGSPELRYPGEPTSTLRFGGMSGRGWRAS